MLYIHIYIYIICFLGDVFLLPMPLLPVSMLDYGVQSLIMVSSVSVRWSAWTGASLKCR